MTLKTDLEQVEDMLGIEPWIRTTPTTLYKMIDGAIAAIFELDHPKGLYRWSVEYRRLVSYSERGQGETKTLEEAKRKVDEFLNKKRG